jgi:hypothetical protein
MENSADASNDFIIQTNTVNHILDTIVMDYHKKTGNIYNRNMKLSIHNYQEKIIKLLQHIENALEIQFIGICEEDYEKSVVNSEPLKIKRTNAVFKIVFETIQDGKLTYNVMLLKLLLITKEDTVYKCNIYHNAYIPKFYSYNRFIHTENSKKFLEFLFKNVSDQTCEQQITKLTTTLDDHYNYMNIHVVSIEMQKYDFGIHYQTVMLDDLIPKDLEVTVINYERYADNNNKKILDDFGKIMFNNAKQRVEEKITNIDEMNDADPSKKIYQDIIDNKKLDLNDIQAEMEYFIGNFDAILIKANVLFYLNNSGKAYEKLNLSNILITLPNNIYHFLHKMDEEGSTFNDVQLSSQYINPYVQIIKPYVEKYKGLKGNIGKTLVKPIPLSQYFKMNSNHTIEKIVMENNVVVLEQTNEPIRLINFLTIQDIFEYEYILWLHESQLKLIGNGHTNELTLKNNYVDYVHNTIKSSDNLLDQFYLLHNTNCEYNPFHKIVEYEYDIE